MPAGDLVNPLGQRVQIPHCPLNERHPSNHRATRSWQVVHLLHFAPVNVAFFSGVLSDEGCSRTAMGRTFHRVMNRPAGRSDHLNAKGSMMSDATHQAINDAIAAHIADESDGEVMLLTDWLLTAAAALADNHDRTMYFNIGTSAPYHSRLGLMYRGLELLEGGAEDDD